MVCVITIIGWNNTLLSVIYQNKIYVYVVCHQHHWMVYYTLLVGYHISMLDICIRGKSSQVP